jgi:drug/metabolite transporter (DMT)-like permease
MLCFQIEPVTATLGAWLLLAEPIGLKAVVGAVVIILGVLTSELGGMLLAKKETEKSPPQ